MPTRSAALTAVALVPIFRAVLDAHDAAVELAGLLSGPAARVDTTVGDWDLTASAGSPFGLGLLIEHEPDRFTSAVALLGPFALTALREPQRAEDVRRVVAA